MAFAVAMGGWLMLSGGTVAAAAAAQIGSWVLDCAGANRCTLRLKARFLDQAGVTGDLEVLALGRSLVPVLTVRGLPPQMVMAAALAGKAEATLRFAGGPQQVLACAPNSLGYVCSARDDATAAALAAGLPGARSVTVLVTVTMPGTKPLRVQEKTVELTGTEAALARLRAAGASALPGPMTELASQSPAALMGMADKALKAAGYPDGVAGLVAKYRGK